ncbi:MAG: hypothetical protein NC043_00310 [Muribaculaceae bacterium]|nr:hypothetical protein [Muribaculaceae bacterium]
MNTFQAITAIFALSSASYASAMTEAPDTLLSVEHATEVTVTESPNGMKVEVKGLPSDSTFTTTYVRPFDSPIRINARRWNSPISLGSVSDNKPLTWDLTVGGPGIGWINACGQPDGTGIEMGKSLEISWLHMIGVKYIAPWRTSSISLGFGFDWRNYRNSTSSARFIPLDNGTVGLAPYPDDVTHTSSRLKVFSMGLPLLWHQTLPFNLFSNRAIITLGAVFCYNSHASLRTAWTDADGVKVVQTSNDIGQRRFSVDMIAVLRLWGGLGVYARYSPNSVLRGAGQLQFRPLSTGLILYY